MSDFARWLLEILDMSADRFIRLALRWLVVLSAAVFVLAGLTAIKTGAVIDIVWAILIAAVCFEFVCILRVAAQTEQMNTLRRGREHNEESH